MSNNQRKKEEVARHNAQYEKQFSKRSRNWETIFINVVLIVFTISMAGLLISKWGV